MQYVVRSREKGRKKKAGRTGWGRTQEEIPDALQLDTPLELGMSEHLAGHRIPPHVLFIYAHRLRPRVHLDNTGRETPLELLRQLWGHGLGRVEDDEREDAVRRGRCCHHRAPKSAHTPRGRTGDAPTGVNFAWSFPTPFTACSSMSTACPGRSFASTMAGFVGAGAWPANTTACSPCGCHVKCAARTSGLWYSANGSVLGLPLGAFSLRLHSTASLKTSVLRSVGWSVMAGGRHRG